MLQNIHKTSVLLVFTCQHVLVGIVRDGEDMRRSFTPLLSSIGNNHFLVVDWQPLVGVNSHTEQPRVGLKFTYKSFIFNINHWPFRY